MLSIASTARNAALLGEYKTAKQLLEKLVQEVCEEGIGYTGQNMNHGAVDVVVRGNMRGGKRGRGGMCDMT